LSADNFITEFAVRHDTIFRHVLEPGTGHSHLCPSSDEARVRLNLLDYTVFVVIEFNRGDIVIVVDPILGGIGNCRIADCLLLT
jgi:hypothetical protein